MVKVEVSSERKGFYFLIFGAFCSHFARLLSLSALAPSLWPHGGPDYSILLYLTVIIFLFCVPVLCF